MEVVVKPNDDGSCFIAISGAINEYSSNQFQRALKEVVGVSKIEIDLGQVDVMNSIGSMYWSNLIRSLCKTASVKLVNCSINMMGSLSRMPAMLQTAEIVSFQVPFGCPQCRRIFSHTLSSEQLDENQFPEVRCDKCSSPSVPEVDFDDYAFFHQKKS